MDALLQRAAYAILHSDRCVLKDANKKTLGIFKDPKDEEKIYAYCQCQLEQQQSDLDLKIIKIIIKD